MVVLFSVNDRTFSSAVLNTSSFKLKTNALIVGEPTGNKPNHYGETREIILPNSKIRVTYSTKSFKWFKEDEDAIYPDIPVDLLANDYFSGRDPMLDKIMEYQE